MTEARTVDHTAVRRAERTVGDKLEAQRQERITIRDLEAGRGLTVEQYTYLLNPLRSTRVASRKQGGKNLFYLEAWDVKAHLTRIFGFGNWDSEVVDYGYVDTREYDSKDGNPMVEVIYRARIQLTIRDQWGHQLCRHSEVAVGSTSGPANMLGEHHDNAVKTAASDALKRCAINLGTQFGLSLYDNGAKTDVIKKTLVTPEGYVPPEPSEKVAQAKQDLEGRLNQVKPSDQPTNEGSPGE